MLYFLKTIILVFWTLLMCFHLWQSLHKRSRPFCNKTIFSACSKTDRFVIYI